MVSEAYGGLFETSLKHAVFAPKHAPMPLPEAEREARLLRTCAESGI
jgi:hypothetical protein